MSLTKSHGSSSDSALEIVYGPLRRQQPCQLRHDSGKPKKSCQENPYCLHSLLHPKEGIWEHDNAKFLQLHLGTNLNDLHRPDKTIPVRLKNLGATCYLNVLMQCLYQNILIRNTIYQMFTQESVNSLQSQQVLQNLQEIFAYMDLSVNNTYNLSKFAGNGSPLHCFLNGEFNRLIGSIGLDLAEQQDPQEFNKLFLDKIDEINQSAVGIKSHIQGLLRYTTVCLKCHNESIRHETFLELGLSIENCSTLEECISKYFKEEYMNIEDGNGYDCSSCRSKQNAYRKVEIDTSPDVLFLQLLRYVYDKDTFEKKKVRSRVSFPGKIAIKDGEYRLVAVLYHKGLSAYGGHYMCEALNWKTQSWWRCDDELISHSLSPDSDFQETNELRAVDSDVHEVISVNSDSAPPMKRRKSSEAPRTSRPTEDSLDRAQNAYMLVYVKQHALQTQATAPPEHIEVSSSEYTIDL